MHVVANLLISQTRQQSQYEIRRLRLRSPKLGRLVKTRAFSRYEKHDLWCNFVLSRWLGCSRFNFKIATDYTVMITGHLGECEPVKSIRIQWIESHNKLDFWWKLKNCKNLSKNKEEANRTKQIVLQKTWKICNNNIVSKIATFEGWHLVDLWKVCHPKLKVCKPSRREKGKFHFDPPVQPIETENYEANLFLN